ncbi:MAG: hypothetical protein HQL72_02330 [Magnetococcales bacterium]|nr:hypothetical protein [Magnetococcales bacterium]
MNNIINRLKEPSSWRGLAMMATAFGISVSPEMMEYIIAAGTGLSGLIGTFTADKAEG